MDPACSMDRLDSKDHGNTLLEPQLGRVSAEAWVEEKALG